jgi:hypothetical protein
MKLHSKRRRRAPGAGSMIRESCWQCGLDIPHVCYAGMPNARWGLGDEAVAALEAARRYLKPSKSKKRRTS